MGLAHAAIAEEDGKIIGALFLQLAWHMEPLVMEPEKRGKVSFRSLADAIDQFIENMTAGPTEYYVFSPNKKIGAMAKIHGMEQKPYRVWFKKLLGKPQEEVA